MFGEQRGWKILSVTHEITDRENSEEQPGDKKMRGREKDSRYETRIRVEGRTRIKRDLFWFHNLTDDDASW